MKTPSRQLLVRTCTPVLNSSNDLFVMISNIRSYSSVAECGDSQTDEQLELVLHMVVYRKNDQKFENLAKMQCRHHNLAISFSIFDFLICIV